MTLISGNSLNQLVQPPRKPLNYCDESLAIPRKNPPFPLHLMQVQIRPVGRIFDILHVGLLQAKTQKRQLFPLSEQKIGV